MAIAESTPPPSSLSPSPSLSLSCTLTLEVFKAADADRSGYLDMEELAVLLGQAELGLTQQEVMAVMAMADTDSSGHVSFEEFCGMVDKLTRHEPAPILINQGTGTRTGTLILTLTPAMSIIICCTFLENLKRSPQSTPKTISTSPTCPVFSISDVNGALLFPSQGYPAPAHAHDSLPPPPRVVIAEMRLQDSNTDLVQAAVS